MSIEYYAVIIVGLPRGDFKDGNKLGEWRDSDKIQCCAPYYDGDEHGIYGIEAYHTDCYSATELNYDPVKIEQALLKFKDITGMDGKIWLSPKGS